MVKIVRGSTLYDHETPLLDDLADLLYSGIAIGCLFPKMGGAFPLACGAVSTVWRAARVSVFLCRLRSSEGAVSTRRVPDAAIPERPSRGVVPAWCGLPLALRPFMRPGAGGFPFCAWRRLPVVSPWCWVRPLSSALLPCGVCRHGVGLKSTGVGRRAANPAVEGARPVIFRYTL